LWLQRGRHRSAKGLDLFAEAELNRPFNSAGAGPHALLKSHGKEWFEGKFLPTFHPVMIGALLVTLVLIFAF
jgi:hypothetical protein